MIKKINRIMNFGIYRDYQVDTNFLPFSKYNLLYGWNGSGKSTFSRLMRMLSSGVIPPEFNDCQIEVELENGLLITHQNLESLQARMLVFNQDFIDENINWNQVIKSILLISEEKIDEQVKLEKINEELVKVLKEREKMKTEYEKEFREINNFLSETASKIRTQFQKIEIDDKYYLNYNKRTIQKLFENNNISPSDRPFSLSEIDKISKSIKPVEKSLLHHSGINFDRQEILQIREKVLTVLRTSYISFSIQKLKNDSKLSNWVEQGLMIHRSNKNETCEFCGEKLSQDRLLELEQHFNQEYMNFKDNILKVRTQIENKRIEITNFPHTNDLYDELQFDFNQHIVEIAAISDSLNRVFESWYKKLTEKLNDPFGSIENYDDFNEIQVKNLFYHNEAVLKVIRQHNEKTTNFKQEIARLKKSLEIHMVLEATINFKFFAKQSSLKKKHALVNELTETIHKYEMEKMNFESSLSNQFLGATEFNKRLHSFLGHKEIWLQFDDTMKGYQILRNGAQAKNLSEGEKTAIAFVYFITKLKEHGTDISNSILVIDDPISSFDSNNLFHAYSFLKIECQKAEQLFVLTHNFNFYKLIRDWLIKKNKYERDKTPKIRSRFYSVETIKVGETPRKSILVNASEPLLNYHSEYHYIFSRIYKYKDKQSLSLDEAFLMANLCRKLLESFLSFKYPKQRNDFRSLMDATGYNEVSLEKIYKFINKYSHNQSIEFGDDAVDNLLGESQNVISDILKFIHEIDDKHYEEMVEIVEKSA
ncbi:AAA family ATPase [Paenibacillus sp.]|uniref:AAA family ATPase n=1 Tax=Paenibacillus sp. TaxID=58172 RepID=UPI002D28FBE0|nr:AAA family ATPase [Paenibacillus sp.]HZG84069.1 AAA family ATPase [Paenibacillus sp.]